MRARALALLALAAGVLAPDALRAAPESAVMEVEFGPGVAIPLGDYLVTEGTSFSQHVDSTVGFAGQLNLVLNDFEFRYAFAILPTSEVRTSISPQFADRYNSGIGTVNQAIGTDLLGPVQAGEFSSSGESITVHHINGGYRIHFYRSDLRVYMPVGLGLALTTGPESMLSRTLYGLSANAGIGLDYDLTSWFRLGGSVRYMFTFSESAGDVTLANVIANFGFSEQDLSTSYHMGHLLHIAANAVFNF
jgi:hypothetical protein